MAVKKKRVGRPKLPSAERSARILSVRLLPRDVALLAELASDSGLSDGEIVRAALAELSSNKAARARLRTSA